MHDLQRWSEDEVSINKRDQKLQMPRDLTNSDVTTQQKDTGAKSKAIELVKAKLNIRCKGLKTTVGKNTKKTDRSGSTENNKKSDQGKGSENVRTEI